MKTLLIGINSKYIHPALSIYQLAANTSYDVLLKEFTIKDSTDNILNYIISEKPDVLGFSVYIWNVLIVREISSQLKNLFPSIKIIYGGPEVSFDPETYLYNKEADFVIYSEGEVSFHLLLKALDKNTSFYEIPNIVFLDNNKIIRNYLELPNLNDIKLATLNVQDFGKRIVYLESSRGCPYHCSYCVASTNNHLRMFPLEYILNILKTLMERKTKTIKFLDRTFNADTNYLTTILDFIEKNNICTTFQFEIVVDRLSDELIQKIGSYNNSHLRFEVGIQSTNDLVNKSIRRHQNMSILKENVLKLNKYSHITLHVDLIAGLPYEDLYSFKNSFNETFSLFAEELQLGFLKFLKGTHMMNLIDKHEYLYQSIPPYEIISNKYLSSTDLEEIHKVEQTLEKFYNSGRFKSFWLYIKNHNVIDDYYQFFLELFNYLEKQNFSYLTYQIIDLFKHLDNFLEFRFKELYISLHEQLLFDYYSFFKVKPTIWKSAVLSKEEKREVFPYLLEHLPKYTLEDLYRYSIVIKMSKNYLVSIYQRHQNDIYII